MRNFIFFVFVVIFALATTASCQNQKNTTTTTVETTIREIGSEGFLIKKVIKGDTVWGYSDEVYGTGTQWRDIVAENQFLNEPGRIYYDEARQKWIVIIYPGEIVKIKGQIITPTFVSEEKTTTVTSETTGIPWWGWTLIAAGSAVILFFVIGMVGLSSFYKKGYPYCPPATTEDNSETTLLRKPVSMDYQTNLDGSFSLTSRGFGETTFSRDAEGRTTLSVR